MILDIFFIVVFSFFLNWLISLHFYLQANTANVRLRNQLIFICIVLGIVLGIFTRYLQ